LSYCIRHTIKQHGDAATEAKRGQIAVTLSDVAKISLITSKPDDIFADGKNKIGRDGLFAQEKRPLGGLKVH